MDYQDFASPQVEKDLNWFFTLLPVGTEGELKDLLNCLVNSAFDVGYEEGKEAEENARDDAYFRMRGN